MIKRLKNLASLQGLPTIAMDAGDFLEGNIYYLAERGKTLYKIHGNVGFDVAVIGNHDYLMGAHDLNVILRDVNTSFQLLGANFYTHPKYTSVQEKIKPYWETVVNGVKVGVIGITTNDLLYKWRIGEGGITNEIKAAKTYAKVLRDRGNDVIVALTHVGLKKDKKIAKAVPEIDLIVGAALTQLFIMLFTKSQKMVSVFQLFKAGKHAQWLGQLQLFYNSNDKKLEIKNYRLLPVNQDKKHQIIEQQIKEANLELEDQFGKAWLNETLGESRITPVHRGGRPEIWYHFITDAMTEAIDADFGVHVSSLSGYNYPIGKINRRSIYNSNPRTFEFDRHFGYNVYATRIRGVWISLIARIALRFGLPMFFSGLTFDYKIIGDSRYTFKYKIKIFDTRARELTHLKTIRLH